MSVTDLSIYFSPVDAHRFGLESAPKETFGKLADIYIDSFPDWKSVDIALIGVKEDRLSRNNAGCADGCDAMRPFLYRLFPPGKTFRFCDFGNILPGETVEDTQFALKAVVGELVRHEVIPLIIGGSQDLTFANFSAYEKLEQTINVLSVDRIFDLTREQEEFHSEAYLNRIILHEPNFLFNYSNIGYQTYFLSDNELQLMEKLYFDTYRLGYFKNNMAAAEPIVRNADLITFDMSAIRQSDAPGSANAGPNGFYGEEACQISRYAGMSDKLTSFGIYEFNPEFDRRGQTAHLLAQMVWCFVEGFYSRKNDFPFKDENRYLKYKVAIQDFEHEMLFYKSKQSDRWWLSVPYPESKHMRFSRHHLVPCAYEDYQQACREEVPDLWWKTFQKIT